MIEIGFTPPNRYRPNPNFESVLGHWMNFQPPAGNWLSDMLMYYQWARRDGTRPYAAWKKLKMRVQNAAKALDPASGKDPVRRYPARFRSFPGGKPRRCCRCDHRRLAAGASRADPQ